jgi:hypothetical protein
MCDLCVTPTQQTVTSAWGLGNLLSSHLNVQLTDFKPLVTEHRPLLTDYSGTWVGRRHYVWTVIQCPSSDQWDIVSRLAGKGGPR